MDARDDERIEPTPRASARRPWLADFAAFNAFAAWAGAIGLVTGDGAGAPQGLTLLTDHIHRNDTAARAVAELIDTILHEHPTSISHDQVMGG